MNNAGMFIIFTIMTIAYVINFVSVLFGMEVDPIAAAGAYLLLSIFAGLFAYGEWDRIRKTKEESE